MKDHILRLFLSSELNMGLVDLQAKKRLGRSFAGLLALTEGLHSLGCLSEEEYNFFKKRYSDKLVKKKPLTPVQLKQKEKLEAWEQQFSGVLSQWTSMKPQSKRYYVEQAQKYLDSVPNAKLILDLAEGEL